eukprot:Gb_38277 [translate_table: standard]
MRRIVTTLEVTLNPWRKTNCQSQVEEECYSKQKAKRECCRGEMLCQRMHGRRGVESHTTKSSLAKMQPRVLIMAYWRLSFSETRKLEISLLQSGLEEASHLAKAIVERRSTWICADTMSVLLRFLD